ncbi:MAG: hypothetical protein ABIQ16_22390, partial [Polyangiaceae bacterium]
PPASAATLQDLHEQRLEVQPPSAPPQRLEFGPGRLLQASADHVVLRDTAEGELLSEVNIGTVLAVAHGSDGALFGVGISGGTRFESHVKKARAFPHAVFFPGSILFPDLEVPSQFYVDYPSEQELLRYSFESEAGALLPIDARIPFAGCTSAPTQLRDGAFACRTATGFARKAPRGTRTDFKPAVEFGQPFWLLPAKRLDELYAIDRAGQVKHVRLVAGVPVLGAFQLPAPPYAAAANGEALAFVLVSPPAPGRGRRFCLLVTDFDGQVRLQVELGSRPAPAEEDWARIVTEDKNLALSAFEPLVAVGGAVQVTVWDYRAGKPRFAR